MYKYSLKTSGGTAWLSEGVVYSNNGIITLNEYPLYTFLKQFEGQHVEIAVMPVVPQYSIDAKIRRLVNILNEKGYKTISSCEGHVRNEGIYRPFPWIAFQKRNDLQYGYFVPPEGSGWMLSYFKDDDPLMLVPIWRTQESASSIEELTFIQDKYINALIEKL